MEWYCMAEKLSGRISRRHLDSGIIKAVGVWFRASSTGRYLYLMRNDPKHSADRFNLKSLSKNEYKDKMALLFQGGVFTSANFKGNIKYIK